MTALKWKQMLLLERGVMMIMDLNLVHKVFSISDNGRVIRGSKLIASDAGAGDNW